MTDFCIEGLERARAVLVKATKEWRGRTCNPSLRRRLVEELYTEIRAARIKGVPWRVIADSISAPAGLVISSKCLSDYFNEYDRRVEQKTGVSALPHGRRGA